MYMANTPTIVKLHFSVYSVYLFFYVYKRFK